VLASQALAGLNGVDIASRLDPVESDVGSGQPGEGADTEEGGPHDDIRSRRLYLCKPVEVKIESIQMPR
jgi:hypothetical protein